MNNRSVDGIQSPAAAVADAARSALEGQLFELQMFNDMRNQANEHNARLLGYMKEINSRNDLSRFAGAGTYFDDLISDIESERYYVIVTAYDFRAATQEKKRKLLWSTRVSIQTQGNRFNESLATMLANASRHFGQDSGHLIKQYLPNTRVDLGELKILGMVPQSSMPEKPAPEK
jgi:erythromycin esterase-like protein